MNRVLHRNKIDAEVTAVTVILSKTLPYSKVHRLAVEYRDAAYDHCFPRTLFLKLAKPGPNETGDIGQKEVEFYSTVAPSMSSPPVIRCFDAAFSAETGRSHVLMQDLYETHSQPPQNSSPSLDMSRLAVEALAKAHAAWWDNPKLGNGIGEFLSGDVLEKFIENLNETIPRFLKVAGLTIEQDLAYRQMLDAAESIWGRLSRPENLTATHGDLHWWNFLFPRNEFAGNVYLFDWQLWHVDLGARDLAFLLALGGFAEPRPEIEEELLRVYHGALGMPNYSWEMLLDDYRWSAIRNLNVAAIFWSQGKHEDTWRTALRRAFEAYLRLKCAELIT